MKGLTSVKLERPQLLWLIFMFLAACTHAPNDVRTPLIGYDPPILEYHFDTSATDWDTFHLPENQAAFSLSDNALLGQVAANMGYIWSLNHRPLTDLSVRVDSQQLRGSVGNGFGIICRADADGNGYYFVVSSAGAFAILKAQPSIPNPIELVKWQNSPAVKTGDAVNRIETLCVKNYLGFIINGILIAETNDSTLPNGQFGLVLGAVEQPLSIKFDNVIIREVRVIGG
ncbi:MAG: hypothetical protein R3E39_14345 [Anaerolineae bacterium]